ncbi:hypothetical protein O9K51_07529 [Purpureocillium lavendulum]|uniref:Uncharacterized protein n=1 Tax=Purpureocillium lavendulum TaxID=1247861 RepID=A0AB34FLP0_9HYPO|nr:hypothetical protein O9K51_07529 [Purpureocillium lavendulum]
MFRHQAANVCIMNGPEHGVSCGPNERKEMVAADDSPPSVGSSHQTKATGERRQELETELRWAAG